MKNLTIGIMSAGDMGHAVAGVLVNKGFNVLTVLDGRSNLTRSRAKRSNMEEVTDLNELVVRSDFVFSIMPPESAKDFASVVASEIQNTDESTVFVDCNAISPNTTNLIANDLNRSGAKMLNIGIIGPPPGRGSVTKFYASGADVEQLSFLDSNAIKFVPVGDDITKASSIKMCYAGLTKGLMTLHTSVLVAAELLGISKEIQLELEASQQYHWEAMNRRISTYACDAKRWAGEMVEISETFGSAGLTPNLHKGAAEVFRMLDASPLGSETREKYDADRTMQQSIEIYAETVRKLQSQGNQ